MIIIFILSFIIGFCVTWIYKQHVLIKELDSFIDRAMKLSEKALSLNKELINEIEKIKETLVYPSGQSINVPLDPEDYDEIPGYDSGEGPKVDNDAENGVNNI